MVQRVVEDAEVRQRPESGQVLAVMLKSVDESKPILIKNGPKAGQTFTKLKWKFTVVEEGPFLDYTLYGDTDSTISVHPENRFRLWAEALLQQPLDLGAPIDEQDLVGLIALARVYHEPYTKDGQEKVAVKVADLLVYDGR